MAIDKRKTGALQIMTGLLALKGAFASETLAGDVVLTRKSAQFLRIDPSAARNIDLPRGADGMVVVIANVGTGVEDITLRKPGAGATVSTITPTDLAIVAHLDGDWALIALIAGVVS